MKKLQASELIIKMLHFCGYKDVTFKQLKTWNNKVPWYEFYTTTEGKLEEFKKKIFVPILKKQGYSKKVIENSWAYFNLEYGLKEIKES